MLAAIEMATKTLEHTYSDEIEASRTGAAEDESGDSGSAATEQPGAGTDAEADKS